MRFILCSLLIFLSVFVWSRTTFGHGTGFIEKQYSRCCGPSDCFRLKVRYTPGGWLIEGLQSPYGGPWMEPPALGMIVPLDKVLPSGNGSFWACFELKRGRPTRYIIHIDGRPCFFQPPSGQ